MAITLFGSISVPADNGTSALNPTAFANPPIASMTTGDLVFVYAWCRTGSATIAVSNAGGQTWNSFTSTNATNATGTANAFWCRYNGTWSAAPSFSFGATTNNTVAMMVFRPSASANFWGVDGAKTGSFTQQTAAATFTITGWTPTNPSNVSIGVWCTDDDNTWGTLTGTNWSKTSLTAQYRNVAGNDTSVSFAYQIQTAAAATNNVAQTETALGNDGGLTFGICFYEYDPSQVMSLHRVTEQPYFIKPVSVLSGWKGGAQIPFDTDATNYIATTGISNSTHRVLINQFVGAWKSAGLWNKSIAVYLFVGGTGALHKWNLKDPRDADDAFRLDFQGSWTHDSNGITVDCVATYAKTFITRTAATIALGIDNATMMIYSRTSNPSHVAIGGQGQNASGTQPDSYIVINVDVLGTSTAKGKMGDWDATPELTFTAGFLAGLFSISILGNTRSFYLNGVLKANDTPGLGIFGFPGNSPDSCYIGAMYNAVPSAGTPTEFDCNQYCFAAILGDNVTTAENAAAFTIVNNFQIGLGRNAV